MKMALPVKLALISTLFASLLGPGLAAQAGETFGDAAQCLENPQRTRKMIDDLLAQAVCDASNGPGDCANFGAGEAGGDGPGASIGALTAVGGTLSTLEPPGGLNKARDLVQVRNVGDFRRHMELHIQRVEKLGNYLLTERPDLFPGVEPEKAREFLLLHDQSKVNDSLSKGRNALGLRRRTIIERLFRFYGVPDKALTDAEKRQRTRLINELNKVDDDVAHDFFKRHGLLTPDGKPNAVAQSYLKLELAADKTDRTLNPVSVEEFGRKMSPSSRFLRDPEQKKFALEFEKTLTPEKYDELTKSLAYRRASLSAARTPGELIRHGLRTVADGVAKGRTFSTLAKVGGMRALGAAALIADAKPVACAQPLDAWVDYQDKGCKPIRDVTPRFAKFLVLPEEEQMRNLKSVPMLCDHLIATHQKIHNHAWGAQCQQKDNAVAMTDFEKHQISVRADAQGTFVFSDDRHRQAPPYSLMSLEFGPEGPRSACVSTHSMFRKAQPCEYRVPVTKNPKTGKLELDSSKLAFRSSMPSLTKEAEAMAQNARRSFLAATEAISCCAASNPAPGPERCRALGVNTRSGPSRSAVKVAGE